MRREDLLDLNEAVQNPGRKLLFEVSTELPEEEDLDLLEPLSGQIQAVSTGNLLLLTAEISTRCVVECARCTHPLEIVVSFRMEDQFMVEGVPSCYGSDGYAVVVDDEPEPLFHNNSLFRDRWVRQGLLLNIPVQPLCEYGWDGPCPFAALPSKFAADAGHPALQRLAMLKRPADEGKVCE
jgi:uncharacterized protein